MDKMAPMEAALTFKDLHKTYRNGTQALRGLNLRIPQGAFFGLLGLNGAGKTTCINVIAGLVRPTKGQARVCGLDALKHYRQAHRLVGIAPQEIALDSRFLSVRQILVYYAGYFGIPKSVAQRRADALLEEFELSHKRQARVQELSGGMKRRLSLAKALIHDPLILILDEPTAGADVALRHQIWEKLKGLNAQGKTILLTTHYLEEAEKLCDQVAILHQGRVVQSGSPQALVKTSIPDQVVIHTDPPLKEIPAGCPQVGHVRLDQGSVRLNGSMQAPHVLELLSALQRQGIKIQAVETQRARLEDAFLDLIQQEPT